MWRGSQDRGEVARDLSYHLTTAVRLHVGDRQQKHFIANITLSIYVISGYVSLLATAFVYLMT